MGEKSETEKKSERNRELESEIENLKLEKINEKNKMTQKFETDKEQLAKIALDLEKSIENIKIELEKSEDAGATSIGRITDLELELEKNREISNSLRSEVSEISE